MELPPTPAAPPEGPDRTVVRIFALAAVLGGAAELITALTELWRVFSGT